MLKETSLHKKTTINCQGHLIDCSFPKVMGILNITEDSFYDGGSYKNETDILKRVETILSQGGDITDIGACSSRPGSEPVSEDIEIKRIRQALKFITKAFPKAILSIDTFRSKAAYIAIQEGAHIINDITGGEQDKDMFETIAKLQVPYIIMHMRGVPRDMQHHTAYDHLVSDIVRYFAKKKALLNTFGIHDLIIDPGFGFAKTLNQNYKLIKNLEKLTIVDLPILVGVSRKSMSYKLLGGNPQTALNGSTVLHTIALLKDAHILRVHDVKEAVETVKICAKFKRSVTDHHPLSN